MSLDGPQPSREQVLERILATQLFATADLEANRAGTLGAEQRSRIDAVAGNPRRLVPIAALVVIAIPSGLLAVVVGEMTRSALAGLATLVLIVLASVSLSRLTGRSLKSDLDAGRVTTVEGVPTIAKAFTTPGGLLRFYLELGGATLPIARVLADCVVQTTANRRRTVADRPFRIYYLPRSMTLLSIEPL